ncbi:MAG: type II toxin-antitoxin system PemK/MazF family toxin [Anaerolineae bacterium]|nr:type II toxin-antitoxin system PemK/MazF family toxin [Anaerolineae bacterium]MCO5196950.1 type II toxin-antitoxin system PemK/MazF family toxin [Anaerolineae bacterium]
MKRGEIRWYTFRVPDKRRPVLILTRQSAIPYLTSVTIAPLTTTIRDIPSEVYLTPDADGVFQECAVNFDNIQSVTKSRIGNLIATLSNERLQDVEKAASFALGLDSLI